ncbi:MAG: DUF4931 domain-containing protein [bacterium]
MPQLRKQLLSDSWVVIAEERKNRPFDFDYSVSPNPSVEGCPFEPGNEEMTPPETDRISAPDSHRYDWLVRSVPNKFPAFRTDDEHALREDGLYSSRGAYGHHEVIIENPQHDLMMDQFSSDHMKHVLRMYQHRIEDLSNRESIEFVQIFRNSGKQAGASLSHPHSQLAAFPFVPTGIRSKLEYSRTYYDSNDTCPVCKMLESEQGSGERIVSTTEQFTALCPYASEYPYEIWVIPNDHQAHFERIKPEECAELAELLPTVVGRLSRVLAEPAFNVVLQSSPVENEKDSSFDPTVVSKCFHWVLKFIPRIKRTGGFELSTNIRINNIPPEYAAEELR